jgi:hypothetical protein
VLPSVFQHHQDEAADESSAPISAISGRTLTKSEETIKVTAKLAQMKGLINFKLI